MSTGTADVAALADEVAQLRDLFQRRLLEDRRRQELYDRLCQELDFARSELVGQFIAPLCRELLLVTDRVSAAGRAGADPAALLASVLDEIGEVLARRGIRPMAALGEAFDPGRHDAVERVPVRSDADQGRVLHERRAGYLIDNRVLRPAQVVVGHRSADEARPAPA
ncbi:nucleotide exchange factor GrpE [Dactylosporangium sp. NPDC051541]|uniref:nucleotide exchange factor GrpE n=1 Tax=Dactylosporangium sp. NPDC051541 TaxID=3363977 RepID=UPI003795B6D5